MGQTVTEKILAAHLVEGELVKGQEIGIRIDQTLTQDATGTMAYLEFEAIGIPRVQTELSVCYVDHNLIQSDFRNADDHRFLQSVARKFGLYFSPPGNGISHQVHLERFGLPGKTLLGSDSHTPTGGGLGMLAMGAGGLDVAMAMAGKPFYLVMPKVYGIKLTGKLSPWVSARDVLLEVLRRLSVKGGVGYVMEYFGPGVAELSVTDRASITNFGAELGATSSVFPSDANTREFLASQGREEGFVELVADPDAEYDEVMEIDLGALEPLIACPSSPDNVVPVREVAGKPVAQVLVGSCSNSSLRDLMVVAKTLETREVSRDLSFEINPGSRQVLENLTAQGDMLTLVKAGARVHQAGCLGCIGMGQAPPTGAISLRTFPRNFPGRSGTKDDQVYLCSPEVAVAAAITGKITDPRELGEYPHFAMPQKYLPGDSRIEPPLSAGDGAAVEIVRGPNIAPFPAFKAPPADWQGEVLLKVEDNITTDHIMPAGARVLPLRSNVPAISEFVYEAVDVDFVKRARERGPGLVVGGDNYGQGSSREHAALAPRYLGVEVKLVKSFARIHKANLINFGIIPLTFADPADYDQLAQGEAVRIPGLCEQLAAGAEKLTLEAGSRQIPVRLEVSPRHREILLAGGLLNWASRQ
ncbi:aconitate hydratase [Desulfurivibrio alkaliphilus]|uniref:Aconitate hydratase n=1 Tax=Desulfurivibrio alkaliphilus (strain DSM 19089 / UNIQEM U267 / AHT2) TaxID=589865 RepID=D6Z4D0_DESAT|nr:aconitate hydratase [Desulfurivibrio alkaliphilus]ADH86405.1 aconitate hydratase [Desulfurivibrio alkaliphilus AHT 2]